MDEEVDLIFIEIQKSNGILIKANIIRTFMFGKFRKKMRNQIELETITQNGEQQEKELEKANDFISTQNKFRGEKNGQDNVKL
ncbi:hypothetical protein BLOT_012479 [Blomia tropicalis]|nr:hypothetical protein BLOT_012479 [Blomia tropicalis]